MSFFDSIFGEYGGDLAIDLGTANTLVSVRGEGIVINEPSVVAIDQSEERVLAVGADAKRMVGRAPGSISRTRAWTLRVLCSAASILFSVLSRSRTVSEKRAAFIST